MFHTVKICDNQAHIEKSADAIFPAAFAHFVATFW